MAHIMGPVFTPQHIPCAFGAGCATWFIPLVVAPSVMVAAPIIVLFRGNMLALSIIIARVVLGLDGLCHDCCCPDKARAQPEGK